MRIISDFHDYYDAVQSTGQDQSLIYFRKREEVTAAPYPFPVIEWSFWLDRRKIPAQEHIIGFCGKIYPAVVLTHVASEKSAVCYNIQEVDSFFENNYRRKEVEKYRSTRKRRWGHGWQSQFCRDAFEKYFTACAERRDAFVEMFREKRCPVWIGTVLEASWRNRTGKIVYNDSLKNLEFFRLFDTYSAFQEIVMFLGGLAVPLKEIPEIPDEIMVGVKGFDQWSFRKPPKQR
jgi:hypothetical protein